MGHSPRAAAPQTTHKGGCPVKVQTPHLHAASHAVAAGHRYKPMPCARIAGEDMSLAAEAAKFLWAKHKLAIMAAYALHCLSFAKV